MGQLTHVIVRDAWGEPLPRVLCTVKAAKAFVCTPELYESCQRGERMAVGFPLEDVYEYNGKLLTQLAEAFQKKDRKQADALWGKLRPVSSPH